MRRRLLQLLPLLALVATAPAGAARLPVQSDARDSVGPLDLHRAAIVQDGALVELDVTTWDRWHAAALRGRPGRSLCLTLGQRKPVRVCVAPRPTGSGLTLVEQVAAGPPRPLAGSAVPRGDHGLRISFSAADAGIAPGPAPWQVVSTWTDAHRCPSDAAPGCTDAVPDSGPVPWTLAPYRPRGCRAAGPSERLAGPTGHHRRREIALTFDDGPASDTPSFLTVLEREHVPGTFFMVGRSVAGHRGLLDRMLGDGDMIGNHTWDHANVAGGGAFAGSEIDRTQAAIRAASGFTPCLFRPPYGARSPGLESVARARGLLTIVWNDDPRDWALPGTGRIVSTALAEAHPDGIVLMHDGGGPRNETLAALPQLIAALRARGYEFVTVDQLLGLRVVYG